MNYTTSKVGVGIYHTGVQVQDHGTEASLASHSHFFMPCHITDSFTAFWLTVFYSINIGMMVVLIEYSYAAHNEEGKTGLRQTAPRWVAC
jgi:hypothetical protein